MTIGLRPHFLDRLPEAERAVGDRELGAYCKSTPPQVEEQLPPELRTLAHAIDEADEFFLALRGGPNDDQQALRGVLEPGLHVDAVNPEVDVAFGPEIALAPARVLVRPSVLEPPDGRSRKPGGVAAEQRDVLRVRLAAARTRARESRGVVSMASCATAPSAHCGFAIDYFQWRRDAEPLAYAWL